MNPVHKGINDLGQYIALGLDKNIYSIPAIMKTCYTLTDSYYMHVTNSTTEQYTVYFYLKSEQQENEEAQQTAVHQFLDELQDNQMRQILITETQVVHEEIVRRAFAPVVQLVARSCEDDELNIMTSAV